MASFDLKSSRLLSGKGTIRTSEEDRQKSRILVLNTKVLRRPTNEYLNLKYIPPRSNYGTLVFSRNGSVQDVCNLEFPLQTFKFISDNDGELMRQVACINQEILQSIANLGIALGLTPISIENETKDWQHIESFWDTCQYYAYGSTAVLFELYALYLDVCEELEVAPIPPEIPLPSEEEEVERDVPLNIDEPLPEDDETTYDPDQLDDSYEEPPVGSACSIYNVVYEYENDLGETQTGSTNNVYGEVSPEIRRVTGQYGEGTSLETKFRGYFPSVPCSDFQYRRLTGGGVTDSSYRNPRIIAINPA